MFSRETGVVRFKCRCQGTLVADASGNVCPFSDCLLHLWLKLIRYTRNSNRRTSANGVCSGT